MALEEEKMIFLESRLVMFDFYAHQIMWRQVSKGQIQGRSEGGKWFLSRGLMGIVMDNSLCA